jgi:hypothetical protein
MSRIITFADGYSSSTAPDVPEYVEESELGVSVATLVSGKVPAAQLPSYVDDVLEYADFASFPVSGSTGIIYVDIATNNSYRWSGTVYVKISNPIADTDDVPEGANLYHTTSRARTAAVVNSTAGSETDQAASVASMKTYVLANAGGSNLTIATKTANYTATASDKLILCDTSGGAFTITLPTAVGISGTTLFIKKTSSDFSLLTIEPDGSETIDGHGNRNLATQNETIEIVSDGTNWHVLRRHIPSVLTSFSMSITATTSNPTKNATDETASWRRDRDCMEIFYTYRSNAAGAAGSGTYLFGIPNSRVIDTTKIQATSSAFRGYCGGASIGNNSANYVAYVRAYDTTNLSIYYDQTAATSVALGSGNVSLGIANTVVYSFYAKVPIVGWES